MLSWADALAACASGLMAVFAWPAIGLLVIGVAAGAVVGLLPGLGGAATLAMLLPFAVDLSPTQTFALLMGVAAVAATTGDLTSILVGIPGEAVSAATVVDGYPMALRGEAARAVGASLVSSLAGSCIGALTLVLTIPLALPVARAIGSPELFMLALLGISFIGSVSRGATLKGLAAGALGLLLATIGLDPISASPRFTFGQLFLWDGIGLIPASLGLYAVPEILQLHAKRAGAMPSLSGSLHDGLADVKRQWRLVVQSSVLGSVVGLIPGIGASVSQWLAYGFAARRGATAHAFGDGAIEGVIAPSAANNATLGGSLTPALAFGLPGGLMSGVMIAALILKGLVPGPAMLMPEAHGGHLTLVFSLVWLLVIANIVAVALAWFATDRLIAVSALPANKLVPFLFVLVGIGALLNRGSVADLGIVAVMSGIGLVFARHGWPRSPLLMGLVLGPLAENRLFLSVEAYGLGWLTRPGVIFIGVAILAGLLIPLRGGATTPARSTDDTRAPSREQWLFVLAIVTAMAVCLVATAAFPSRAQMMPRLAASATIVFALLTLTGVRRTQKTATSAAMAFATLRAPAAWALGFALLMALFGAAAGAALAVSGYLLGTRTLPVRQALFAAALTGATLHFGVDRWLLAGLPDGALIAWLSAMQ